MDSLLDCNAALICTRTVHNTEPKLQRALGPNSSAGYTVRNTMKRYIPLLLDTLTVVALAVWLGGLALCWLVLFPTVHSLSADSVEIAQRVFAETLRRFSAVTETCGIILAALQWVLRRRYQRTQSLFVADAVRTVAMFVALFCAEYGRYGLVPALIRTSNSNIYQGLQALAVVQALMLLAFAAITVHLLSPRLAAISSPASRASPTTDAPRRPAATTAGRPKR